MPSEGGPTRVRRIGRRKSPLRAPINVMRKKSRKKYLLGGGGKVEWWGEGYVCYVCSGYVGRKKSAWRARVRRTVHHVHTPVSGCASERETRREALCRIEPRRDQHTHLTMNSNAENASIRMPRKVEMEP